MRLATLLALAVGCQGFCPSPARAGRAVDRRPPRASAPAANLFDTLGKIADYNKKFIGTAIAGMTDPRTARASHILFGFAKYDDGEAQAVKLKERISSGDISFADAAQEYSTCPSGARGGDLGTFKRGAMVPEFDEVCFNAELGGLEGPIKTQFGHHLIRVVERTEAE